MSVYFEYFPDIVYNKTKIKNISKKVGFMEGLNDEMFLPLTLRDGEKPEDIAYFYYGDVSYAPFILMLNKSSDWSYDWLMSENSLFKYIFNKYKKISKLNTMDEVVRWSQNQNLLENIIYFEDEKGIKYSPDTFLVDNVPPSDYSLRETANGQKYILDTYLSQANYKPVRYFQYEYELNENKRTIYVVDKKYIKDVVSLFKEKIT